MNNLARALSMAGALMAAAASAHGGVDVLTYHNDNGRTGQNLSETLLTPSDVNPNSFGKLFTYSTDGDVYTQPLYVSAVDVPGAGVVNIVIVATQNNTVYAFNADTNSGAKGGLLWSVNFGTAAQTPTPDFGNRYGGFTQIEPQVGITGTPVIDLPTATLYVDSFTHVGSNYFHHIHALNIANGKERPYSPVLVSAAIPGTGAGSSNGVVTFQAIQQLQRSALTLSDGIVYVPYAGYADSDPYHGWILGYNASNLRLTTNYVFNSTPNSPATESDPAAGEGGIWMGGCGLGVDADGYLYFATGNGSFNGTNGLSGTEYGDSVIKLSTAKHFHVADFFTPYNQDYMADNDLDLGSGGIILLPNQPGSVPHMMLAGSKLGKTYVINRDLFTENNSHYNAVGTTDAVLGTVTLSGGNFGGAAYFNGMVYITAANDSLYALTVGNGMLNIPANSSGTRILPFPAATPSISAFGNQNGIVWLLQQGNPETLVADAATNVSYELYSSDQAGARDMLGAGTKFSVPTVANGKVYVGGKGTLTVFGLLGAVTTNLPASGNYVGLFYGTNGVTVGQSGYVSIVVNARADYSGRLVLGSGVYAFSGQFDSLGAALNTVKVAGQDPVQVQMQFTTNQIDQLTGTVGNDVWTVPLTAVESTFNARTNPCPYAGRYNLVMHGPGDGNPLEPQGNGYGIVTINTTGDLVFEGTLADGTAGSQTTLISNLGRWALYAPLYAGQGELIGWVNFPNSQTAEVNANLVWTKRPVTKSSSYTNGFAINSILNGSVFHAGTSKSPLLTFTNGLISFSNGGLSSNITDYFSVTPQQRLEAAGLELNFAVSSSVLRGTFSNPVGGKPVEFIGLFLPQENSGYGYFMDKGLSGAVFFGPQ